MRILQRGKALPPVKVAPFLLRSYCSLSSFLEPQKLKFCYLCCFIFGAKSSDFIHFIYNGMQISPSKWMEKRAASIRDQTTHDQSILPQSREEEAKSMIGKSTNITKSSFVQFLIFLFFFGVSCNDNIRLRIQQIIVLLRTRICIYLLYSSLQTVYCRTCLWFYWC